jgi:hypothetical protein
MQWRRLLVDKESQTEDEVLERGWRYRASPFSSEATVNEPRVAI